MKMASRSTDLISKKTNLHGLHAFLSFFAVVLHDYTLFSMSKTSNFLVTHCFYGWIVVYAYPIFCFLCSCSLLFCTGPHLHLDGSSLLAAGIILIFSPPLIIKINANKTVQPFWKYLAVLSDPHPIQSWHWI